MENKQYDIIAIGDIVTDAFIRLKDAEAYCDIDQENCKLCVRFGDKVPYEFVEVVKAVGNCANASVCGARLGLNTALLSTVGSDINGKECLEELIKNNVSTEFMTTNIEFPTNYHYVLWYGPERTILVKHAPFPYSIPTNMQAPKWIYLTSMGETSEIFHHEIVTYLKNNPETKLAFQPGTFQIKLGKDKLADVYKASEIFFCNVQEAERILGITEHDKIKLMKALYELGPRIIIMTDGINGAYAYDGTNSWFMPVYPHTPIERTGAGDAYASTIVACLSMGMTLEQALMWAPINSMSVVQYVGAQKGLLTQEKIKEFLVKAPEDYKIKKL